MNRFLAAALLSVMASAASAASYMVDFNSYATNANLKGKDLGGVVMTSKAFVTTAPTGTAGILVDNKGRYTNPFIASFTLADVVSVSVDLGDWGMDADNLFLEAYDASNTLLGSVTSYLAATVAGMKTLSLTTTANIAYVKFYAQGLNGENNVYADNLSFSTRELPAVPVPAAGALLVSGLGGLAMLRRRKRG